MIRGINLKLVAISLMLLFIFQIAFPTLSFALTGGPSQPETKAFTPVGSSDLVDLSTGDFSYNIPLMTVPGPNGGESLTLGYKAGATMEEEASWVGLGWDLNVGAINRNLRGLPDDFKGETIKQTHKQKPRRIDNYVFKGNVQTEIFGTKLGLDKLEDYSGTISGIDLSITGGLNVSYSVDNYYNNYLGFGLTGGANITPRITDYQFEDYELDVQNKVRNIYSTNTNKNTLFGFNAGIDFTRDGLNIPMGIYGGYKNIGGNLNLNYGGVQTLQQMNFSLSLRKNESKSNGSSTSNYYRNIYSMGGALSFAKVAPVPSTDISSKTVTTGQSFQFDNATPGVAFGVGLGYDLYSTMTVYKQNNDQNSYGYLYLDFADKNHSLKDFHVDKSLPFSDMASQLPLPVYDYDVYSISGNGVGGTFRAYRNDIGVLRPSENFSNSSNQGYGMQVTPLSTPPGAQIGVDTKAGSKSTSYSGPWRAWNTYPETSNNIHELNVSHHREDITKGLYTPFYFQFTGGNEQTNQEYLSKIEGETPVQYGVHISKRSVEKSLGMRTRSYFGQLSNAAKNKIRSPRTETRQVASSHVSYKTNSELKQELSDYPNKFNHLFATGNPITNSATSIRYDTLGNNNHINELSVESGGVKYVYGLPAYNTKTREVMFSAPEQSHNNHLIDVPSNYANNTNGFDNLYSEKEIPEYAYSYLLTAKYSNNYVDINNDGPTDDDLGGWVKYNYTKIEDFNWRGPYSGASYLKGAQSWGADDKATFTEGTKDIHYVNSIETKTHLAVFELGERNDNLSSANEAGSYSASSPNKTATKTSRFLKKITLYSKKDPHYGDMTKMVPVKTVHFVYDYSQCQGIPNYKPSSNSYPGHIIPDNGSNRGGKLTLKKVYFTYQNNEKGSLIPYEFSYSSNNKGYTYLDKTDRWGNYLEQGNSKEYPYVNQLSTNNNDANASVWNITKISTPSGGEINIEYESDDYGYVQDQQAMQMCEVVGISDNTSSYGTDLPFDASKSKTNNEPPHYIFFKGNTPLTSSSQARAYLKNMPSKWVYFNVNVELRSGSNEMISGYAEWDGDTNAVGVSSGMGYFKVKTAEYQVGRRKNNKVGSIHPFRKAALQHYHNRPDFKPTYAQMKQQIRTFLKGPIHNYLKEGIGNKIVTSGTKSFVRLMSPYSTKEGGGHRVKSIKMFSPDNNQTYGQKYSYITYDEQGNTHSSGVADYEPITGGEENALRIPENYNDVLDYNTDTKGDFFLRKPYMEAFYPAPVVRYGKVIMRNLLPDEITSGAENVANSGGITISEFYTSKDFPIVEITPNKLEESHENRRPSLPFVPMTTREDNAIFSNGSVIILNDMSGKPKAVSTYNSALAPNLKLEDYKGLTETNVTTRVEYLYHTKEGNSGELENKVTVLSDDGISNNEVSIGQKQEMYVFEKENFSLSRNVNTQLNILTTVIPYVFPSFNNSKSVSQRRMISTVKIIHKAGILKEVRTVDDGRKTVASNLAYDAQTGEAVLTKVQNDWDKPIYTYNYSGHWKYPILSGKYANYRAKFKITEIQSGVYTVLGYNLSQGIIQVGDILRNDAGKMAYVSEVDIHKNQFKATSKTNQDVLCNTLSTEVVTVYESGYRNLQQMKVGQLVSLVNPLTFSHPQNGFINHIANNLGQIQSVYTTVHSYVSSCSETYDYTLSTNTIQTPNPDENGLTVYELAVLTSETPCKFYIKLKHAEGQSTSLNAKYFDSSTLKKVSEGEFTLKFSYDGTSGTYDQVAYITSDCEIECDLEGILHASALQLSENWEFNYKDAGNTMVHRGNDDYPMQDELDNGNYNKVAAKNEGTWLPYQSWVYQTERKQKGTKGLNGVEIDKDGEYEKFRFFKWNKPDTSNQHNSWEWSNRMTKYSPYGNELENKNRLGIYSAELYGYNNTVVTATAVNTQYSEIAYENFEEAESIIGYNLTGHFSGTVKTTQDDGHTGNKALLVEKTDGPLSLVQTNFKPKANKKYHLSSWVKTYKGYGGSIKVYQSGNLLATLTSGYTTNTNTEHDREIEGWTQVSGSFTTANTSDITLVFERDGTSDVAFDDLRILPMKASMKSYVYDPLTFKLIATLDDNNFATLYRRDSEGKLVLVKKETEKGMVTVQSTRDNIVK